MIGSPVLSHVNFFQTVGIVLKLQYKSEMAFIAYCMKIHSVLEILFRKFKLLYFQGPKGVYYVELIEESWLHKNFHSHLNLRTNLKTDFLRFSSLTNNHRNKLLSHNLTSAGSIGDFVIAQLLDALKLLIHL